MSETTPLATASDPAPLVGYFIAPDANDNLYIWRERGNYPVPVLARWDLRDDPEVWDILASAIRETA